MSYISTGDMARTYQLRQHGAALKQHLARLTGELASGRKADLAAATGGDLGALAGIGRSLAALGAYRTATAEAALTARTMQGSLEMLRSLASDAATPLLTAAVSGSDAAIATAASDMAERFGAAVSALNVQAAGRFIFSGVTSDARPLPAAGDILATLTAVTATETTAEGLIAATEAWFDAPAGGGGYLDLYGGGAPLAPLRVAAGEETTLDLTAADPDLRDALKGFALAGLLARGALAGDTAGRAALAKAAGERMLAAGDGLVALSARTGAAEARIAAAATRNAAEASALEIARAGIAAADPYETATALEAVRTQIETLHALTARLSRMTLLDHL